MFASFVGEEDVEKEWKKNKKEQEASNKYKLCPIVF